MRTHHAFTRSLLRPIPPASLVALAQAGWPVDFIFRTTINSANGIANHFGAGARARAADPRFPDLMAALRDIQWFWIDDRDIQSKRSFAFLMILSSLTETTGSQSAPVLTIPTG